jgi:2-oxoglutarate dehydrogenase E2 component (dihydrolipoamide succinyltransferase)
LPAWEQPGTGELFRPTEEIFGKPVPSIAPAKAASSAQDEIAPVSPIRKAIAEHMVRSKAIAPHVTSVHEADMSRVIAYQKAHESEFAKQGVKLTFTAFLVQAAAVALKAWPIVNASYTDQGIVMKRDLNIGIAVAMEDGLIVPVIKHADDKSLLGIARAVNDLATRAREKRLSPDEVQGGTFTITNYGVFGSLFGTPVINQPQSAILGVGTIQKRAVVTSASVLGGGVSDAIAIRPMIYLSITIDHRLLDGAIGDQFMQKLKRFLEEYPVE